MSGQPLSIFQVAGRAMSAQLVRMNTTASNLANAGGTAGSAEAAYRTMKPVFRTQFEPPDRARDRRCRAHRPGGRGADQAL